MMKWPKWFDINFKLKKVNVKQAIVPQAFSFLPTPHNTFNSLCSPVN
jgi:hypothetical protein